MIVQHKNYGPKDIDDSGEHSDNNSTSGSGYEREKGKYGFQLDDYIVSNKVKEYVSTEENYEYCPNCERKFFIGRLKLHMKSCKVGKPLKPKKNNENLPINTSPSINSPKKVSQTQEFNQQSTFDSSRNSKVNDYKSTNDQSNHTSQKFPLSNGAYSRQASKVSSNNGDDYGHYIPNSHSQNDNNNSQEEENDNNEDGDNEDRVPCSLCGRKFDHVRIEKHEKVCAKTKKKRPVFDMKKKRVIEDQKNILITTTDDHQFNGGSNPTTQSHFKQKKKNESNTKRVENTKTEQDNSLKNVNKQQESISKKSINHDENNEIDNNMVNNGKKIPKWKIEHENFLKNIKFNKKLKAMEVRGEDTSHMRAPETYNPDYVPCPYCFRKFAPKTADRHIPKCKDTFNRPKPPKSVNPELQNTTEREKINAKTLHSTKMKLLQNNTKNIEDEQSGIDKDGYNPNKYIGSKSAGLDEKSRRKKIAQFNERTPNNEQKNSLIRDSLPNSTAQKQQFNDEPGSNNKRGRSLTQELVTNHQKLPNLNLNSSMRTPSSQSGPGFTKENFSTTNETANSGTFDETPSNPYSKIKGNRQSGIINPGHTINHPNQFNYEDVLTRSSNYSTVMCQYCCRKFAPKSAERHIPICKNLKYRVVSKYPMKETMGDMAMGNTSSALTESLKLQSTTNKFGGGTTKYNLLNGEGSKITTATDFGKSTMEKDKGEGKLMRINMGKQIANLEVVAESDDTNRSCTIYSYINVQQCVDIDDRMFKKNMMPNINSPISALSNKNIFKRQSMNNDVPQNQQQEYNQRTHSGKPPLQQSFCTQCGGKVERHHKFCGFCGNKRS